MTPVQKLTAATRWLALALLLPVGACSKKDDGPAPTTGFNWTADATDYAATTATATSQGLLINLTGIATSGSSTHVLSLAVPAAVGTYNTAATTAGAYYYLSYSISSGTNSVIYSASNAGGAGLGTVTITTFSATDIVGTFSFTGATASGGAGKAVTNGKFSIKR